MLTPVKQPIVQIVIASRDSHVQIQAASISSSKYLLGQSLRQTVLLEKAQSAIVYLSPNKRLASFLHHLPTEHQAPGTDMTKTFHYKKQKAAVLQQSYIWQKVIRIVLYDVFTAKPFELILLDWEEPKCMLKSLCPYCCKLKMWHHSNDHWAADLPLSCQH